MKNPVAVHERVHDIQVKPEQQSFCEQVAPDPLFGLLDQPLSQTVPNHTPRAPHPDGAGHAAVLNHPKKSRPGNSEDLLNLLGFQDLRIGIQRIQKAALVSRVL